MTNKIYVAVEVGVELPYRSADYFVITKHGYRHTAWFDLPTKTWKVFGDSLAEVWEVTHWLKPVTLPTDDDIKYAKNAYYELLGDSARLAGFEDGINFILGKLGEGR